MPLTQLDFPETKILMYADNEIEGGFRAHAVQKEGWTADFIRALPQTAETTFWDIGANVGSYTLIACSRSIMTVAVEPSPANYARLLENLKLNDWADRCIGIPGVVTNAIGLLWFHASQEGPGYASHVINDSPLRLPGDGFYHRHPVLTYSIDFLVEQLHVPAPTHIKIDVDGGEGGVLAGAERALANCQGLMIELQPPDEEPIIAWLTERGWKVGDLFRNPNRPTYGRFER